MKRLLLLGLFLASLTLANGSPGQAPPPSDTKIGKGGDPTVPGPALENFFADELPSVVLKARILSRKAPPMAILEIAGQPFYVSVNSEITAKKSTLKVLEINAQGVRIGLTSGKPEKQVILVK